MIWMNLGLLGEELLKEDPWNSFAMIDGRMGNCWRTCLQYIGVWFMRTMHSSLTRILLYFSHHMMLVMTTVLLCLGIITRLFFFWLLFKIHSPNPINYHLFTLTWMWLLLLCLGMHKDSFFLFFFFLFNFYYRLSHLTLLLLIDTSTIILRFIYTN